METIGSYEAKTHLPNLLDRVERGEEITITKHGVPVARLVPVEGNEKHDPREVIEEIKKFRKGRRLAKGSIRKMIREGRRF